MVLPRILLILLVSTAALLLAPPSHARAAAPCLSEALASLQVSSPQGYRVYSRLKEKTVFHDWIKCENLQLELTTAVHESVHHLSGELDGYLLIDGSVLPRVGDDRRLFPPRLLAARFKRDSPYVQTYLMPGSATSADEFGYLLDEMNAYSHDLAVALSLARHASKDYEVYHRDGLAALMAFVSAYVERARVENGATWTRLADKQVTHTVSVLWSQAEAAMGASCRARHVALEAQSYLQAVCAGNIHHGLGQILGRPPLCPVSCLKN